MAKQKPKEVPEKKKDTPQPATAGIKKRLDEKDKAKQYEPDTTQRTIGKYVERRMQEMMDFRKSLGLETRWKEADEEYVPHELDFGTTRKRFETDQDTGLRSRMVPVGDVTQQWRQASSAPTLLAKIQTAVSIIVDNQPEAELVALLKKYDKTTELAYALWKRNWSITDAKEKLKLLIFNLIKYGWAPQRTYPRVVKYPKRILESIDTENPDNNKYSEKEIVWFNDVDREPLNPYLTWIDELSKPYDQYSTNESYFEQDYSFDAFMVEFGGYPTSENVPRDSAMVRQENVKNTNRNTVARSAPDTQNKMRKDVVTVGFFESRHKDLYVLYIPRHKIVLYASPLPNNDGYLSVTHTLWILRNSKLPYGVSLWEVIRQNKALYDKMKNMTMDQLVLSIMKFGFFSGTNAAVGDGTMQIIPGQARQLTSSTGKPEINWMEIPGPGAEAWKGLEAIADMMDDESGITPTLEGDVTGKTLGEILHAKEASLKRLKTPVENIAWAIEQDAYLTLSWMSQVYAIPIVKDFVDTDALMAYENEEQVTRSQLFGTQDEEGNVTGPYQAHYLPQLALHLEDREGKLTKSKQSQFYQVGTGLNQIKPADLKWKGIFKVIPRSIIDSSQTLTKASKMEMFNLLVPLLQLPPEIAAKPAQQIVKVNEEDPKDWLPDAFIQYLEQKDKPTPPGTPKMPPASAVGPGGMPGAGAPPAPPGPGNTMQGAAGMAPPQAPTVVPGGQTSGPDLSQLTGGGTGLFGKGL